MNKLKYHVESSCTEKFDVRATFEIIFPTSIQNFSLSKFFGRISRKIRRDWQL